MSFFKGLFLNQSNFHENNDLPYTEEKILVADPVLGERKFKTGNKSLYVAHAKQILSSQKISIWELNRPLDVEHVKVIMESLEAEYNESQQVTVFGSLCVFRDESGYKIFDGQHRLEALRLMLAKYPILNPEITIESYETKNPVNLFTKLNQIKPQEEKTNPDSRKEQLANMIKKRFADCVRDQQRVNRPRVTFKILMDTISTSDFSENTPETIMSRLEEINSTLAGFDMEKIFGKEFDKDPETCIKIYKMASNIGFYLGMRKVKNARLDWTP